MAIYRKIYKLEKYITRRHFVRVGIILMVLAMFFAYFTFSEYLTRWYGQKEMDARYINHLYNDYFYLFLFANYISILAPIIVIGIPKFRSIRSIIVVSIISVAGLWLNRYLIIVPTLEVPFLPIQDTREAWISYSGTWVELVLSLGGIGTIALLFTLFTKLVPPLDVAEMEEIEEEMAKKPLPQNA